MGSRNYLIGKGSMTLTDQKDYRTKAIAALLARAHDKKIGTISDDEIPGFSSLGTADARYKAVLAFIRGGSMPAALDVREFQPVLDAGTALDQWNTAALAAVGTAYSCFQAVAAPVLAANKEAVFYKVAVETVAMPVSRLTFRSGGATGNIIAVFDLEQMIAELEWEAFFSEPVVIDPTIAFAAQVLCRVATGVLARVQLGGLIAEPHGQTVA